MTNPPPPDEPEDADEFDQFEALMRQLLDATPNDDLLLSDRVHQATGMVAVQLECEPAEALNRLKIRAAQTGESVEDIALDVIDGIVRFSK